MIPYGFLKKIAGGGGPDITTGLIGWWKLDDGSGTTPVDSSATGANGVMHATNPTWVAGHIGTNALQFNGSGYVTVAHNSSFDMGTGDFTVALWFKSDGSEAGFYESPFSKGDVGGSGNGISIIVRNNTIGGQALVYIAGSLLVGTIKVTDNSWHHIAVIRNSGVVSTYIDNTFDNSATISGNTNVTSDIIYLGIFDGSGDYPEIGQSDEIRFYSRALTGPQLTSLFNYT